MPEAVIVSAVRTAIGTSFKGSLTETLPEELTRVVLEESLRRSGLAAEAVDDVIVAEAIYGGTDVARHAAVEAGLAHVPGAAVNRHCAGSLTSVEFAAGSIRAGMDRAVIAGGVHSYSLNPVMKQRVPGTTDEWNEAWQAPSHPDSPDAPNRDMSITVGWNTAVEAGLTRQDMDAWALRSHQRATAAIDEGRFVDEIVPLRGVLRRDGSRADFAVDEHPRRDTSMERLAGLKVLHPEIEGFSITAGNASGMNDAAAAVTVVSDELAAAEGLTRLATVHAWANIGAEPRRNGMAVIPAIEKLLGRAGRRVSDVALWEINEAFASVPVATVRALGIDEDRVNTSGSGCSLGHPIAASGARMLTTMIHELRRNGGGLGVAAMCAAGGMAGAMLVEV
ncbi:thiolase family protein [Jatrophihabitans fulvus]